MNTIMKMLIGLSIVALPMSAQAADTNFNDPGYICDAKEPKEEMQTLLSQSGQSRILNVLIHDAHHAPRIGDRLHLLNSAARHRVGSTRSSSQPRSISSQAGIAEFSALSSRIA